MSSEKNISGLLARKAFHLLGGMLAPLAALIVSREFLLWGLGISGFVALSVETVRFVFPSCNSYFVSLSRPLIRSQEARQITGSTYLLISSFITFFLFPRDLAIIAVSFLAIGDAIGSVVGVAFSSGIRPVKNWQGRLACFSSNLLTSLLLSHFFLHINAFIVLGGATTASIVETLSPPVNDNITIPLSSALVMGLLSIFL